MASLAYSTPVSIPSHERGVSVARSLTAMREADRAPFEGRGCIILDGKLVVFDVGAYPQVGAPALVVFGDGRMEVVPMPSMDDAPRQGMNPGFLMVRVSAPKVGGCRATGEQAALVGAVRMAR